MEGKPKCMVSSEKGLEFFEYPGGDDWPRFIQPMLSDPSNMVATRNPTPRVLTALINLGPDAALQANLERYFKAPEERMKPDEMRERLLAGKLLRNEYVRARLTWRPAGQPGDVVVVPSGWVSALREVSKSGTTVIAGLVPEILIVGEEPLEIHPSLGVGGRR